MNHYDMRGDPISLQEWSSLFEGDALNRVVGRKTLPNGRHVSTVWVGLDFRLGGLGAPLIYESMVFPSYGECGEELEVRRYETREQAAAGHADLVVKWWSK